MSNSGLSTLSEQRERSVRLRGLVIKSTGSGYVVRLEDGRTVDARIKGNFRIRGIRSTNPIAVGDYVVLSSLGPKDGLSTLSEQSERSIYWITEIVERRNYIIRRSTNLSKESHILAANIDQVALIVTINHPVTNTTFIDRFLATCEAYQVPAVLIFNKIDLLTADEHAYLSELRALYDSLGYQTLTISATHLTPSLPLQGDMERVLHLFQGKVTLLSGNSGVGKSTLLNALFGQELTRTGHISDAHDKGMHTTTFSEMYFLLQSPSYIVHRPSVLSGAEGALIDTPGIKGFGGIDMQREEVSHYFREIFQTSRQCRFGNCTHTNEPGCAVQQAVIEGQIAVSRYESYLSLLGDCTESKYR